MHTNGERNYTTNSLQKNIVKKKRLSSVPRIEDNQIPTWQTTEAFIQAHKLSENFHNEILIIIWLIYFCFNMNTLAWIFYYLLRLCVLTIDIILSFSKEDKQFPDMNKKALTAPSWDTFLFSILYFNVLVQSTPIDSNEQYKYHVSIRQEVRSCFILSMRVPWRTLWAGQYRIGISIRK